MVDASLRSMILQIMRTMRDEHGISFLYITHDLATAHQISDETFLMYQGHTVEHGVGTSVLTQPRHPYVQQLVASIPRIDMKWEGTITLPDNAASGHSAPVGCPFTARCPYRMDICTTTMPKLVQIGADDQQAACFQYEQQSVAHS
ncbi:oligopeptide/dipeptide ABC transporter ATP-binding protein [Actinocrispum wychmicini]|uniref:Oligopeptide/dipeptide ABC transporter ATP-binding protein n=2 Tax=Actinocrispum wychmicini TaxID=1213861 RepID=A0A4R2JM16_9PSEU|nr:oligopeptide/dipeptide ABC transporter ATP-binding protein [Actinocrispum wychmicini]